MPKPSRSNRLLMIAYHFPPVKVVSVHRLRNVYRGFRRRWESVHVLTSANRRLFEQDADLAVDARVEEVPAWDVRRLLAGSSNEGRSYRGGPKKGWFQGWASRLVDSFPFNVLISFGGPLYLLMSYRRGLRLVQERKITHLFSSYRPMADHLIAYWLKGRYPHLYWIADFRDLPVDEYRQNTLWPALQHWIYKFLLERADLVTTVSKGLATQLERYHRPVHVLRNGIDTSLLEQRTTPPLSRQAFTITYTGSLYPQHQSARPLFDTLARMIDEGRIPPDRLRLVYAGKDGAIWKTWMQEAGLPLNHIDLGVLPWREAARLQRQSHINLLLSWSSSQSVGILTSKLYEYLAARRPILTLIEGTRDEEWEQLFGHLPGFHIFHPRFQRREELERYLYQQFKNWEEGRPGVSPELQQLSPHTWPVLMDQFIDEIESTV